MACSVICNKKTILRLSNNTITDFHEKLVDVLVREGLGGNKKFVEFITGWDQDIYGGGIVYANFNDSFEHNPKQLALFIPVLDKAISEFCQERKGDAELLNDFKDFRNKVGSYYQSIAH